METHNTLRVLKACCNELMPRSLVQPRSLAKSLRILLLVSAWAFTFATYAAGSREQAAEEAMLQHGQPGKVLSIREKTGDQGNTWFEVKILSNGNVSVYRIQQN